MKRSGRVAVLLAVAVAVLFATAGRASAYVYWINDGSHAIGRANLDGSSADQSFIPALQAPYRLAVESGHLYWSVQGSSGKIGRANIDGTAADSSFITGASFPSGVAVNSTRIYWTNTGINKIAIANLDGSSPNQSFISTGSLTGGIAVDPSHIYWTVAPGAIGRSNLNGGGTTNTFITGLANPSDVAVDASHIYWSDIDSGTIGRADLDGNPASVSQDFITGIKPAEIDVDGSHIYWTNYSFGAGSIGRANLDGSEAVSGFIGGATGPIGLAVDALSPPAPSPPSNAFTLGKAKLNRKKGTATLPVSVPGAGTLTLTGKGVKSQRPVALRPVPARTVTAAGTVTLKIAAKGRARTKLLREGRVKLKLAITFTPEGGSPSAQSTKVKLIRRIR
jgi:virginiamycin B lyase